MTQQCGERFHIHTCFQSHGRERVTKIMEPHLFTTGVFQYEMEPDAFYAWGEKAREKMAECEEGKLSPEEFSDWLKRS